VPGWVILLVAFTLLWSCGGFAAMVFQHAAKAASPSGSTYQVDVGPTGMPWIGTLNWDMSWLGAPIHWVCYLRQRPRTWSVSAARITKQSLGQDLLRESFHSYRDAHLRFREIKDQIEMGDLTFAIE
jgi:hypothetical protein